MHPCKVLLVVFVSNGSIERLSDQEIRRKPRFERQNGFSNQYEYFCYNQRRVAAMKRNLGLLLVVTASLFGMTGCHALHGQNCNNCRTGCGPVGCRPQKIGWQRGGTDYQRHLSHDAYRHQGQSSGIQAPTVAYPYYTTRGPRDFLINNPPTIGR